MCMQHKFYMYCVHAFLHVQFLPFPSAHTHMHACTHTQAHTCAHAHTHTHTHRYTSKAFRYVDVPVYELFILVHTCTDQNMLCTHTIHTHAHTRPYMHAHTYEDSCRSKVSVQAQPCLQPSYNLSPICACIRT